LLITITIGTFDLINFIHYNITIATGKEKDNENFSYLYEAFEDTDKTKKLKDPTNRKNCN